MAQESSAKSGFHGTLGSVPLVDLLQVWSMNRFSGLVKVTLDAREGHLYFVDGEIVHAEAEGQSGEPAVGEIICWRDGAYEAFPNTTTLKQTIQKRLSHLLLDAHRLLDEGQRSPRPQTPAPPPREAAKPSVLDKVRAIPGVTQLVRFGPSGRPVGDGSPEAEQLAAKALYLAMTHATAIAGAFGLRDLSVATLQTGSDAFVLVQGSGNYLCVSVAQGAAADQVAAQLRALMVRPVGS